MAMLIGGLLYSIFFPIWPLPTHLDLFGILSVIFVIIFGTLISYYAYLSAIKIIGPKITSLLTCAEPLSAVILAVVWLKIPFGAYDWVGTIMILTTIVLLTLFKDKVKSS